VSIETPHSAANRCDQHRPVDRHILGATGDDAINAGIVDKPDRPSSFGDNAKITLKQDRRVLNGPSTADPSGQEFRRNPLFGNDKYQR